MDNHSARAGSGNPTWPRAGPKREFMNVACASCESQTSKTKKPPALTAKRWVAKGSRPHHNLALLLELAYKKLDAALIAQLRANGHSDLRPAHSQVFGAIPAEGARVGEMAAHAGITQQSMSELVDSLQRLGYLERRPDPKDRRARIIVFTERGWEAVRAGIATVDRIEQEWAQRIGAAQVAAVREALEVITLSENDAD